MNKLKLLIGTIRYLKYKQVYYRMYYFFRSRIRRLYTFKYSVSVNKQSRLLVLENSILSYNSLNEKIFIFLNLSTIFENKIDWNYSEYGKLWTYNLNYFDYLLQKDISINQGIKLIHEFIDQSKIIKDGLEPFPISLRGVNWIKFLTKHQIKDEKIDNSLYAQYLILMDNLEYHLMGNHLLENGFSLLYGAYYFEDKSLHVKAREILYEELKEQILGDGAHFELSPMYHQIMLFRLLDCINLLQNNKYEKDDDLLEFLEEKASVMLGWLKTITFKDGSIPLLNDSAKNIAPKSCELYEYAKDLNISIKCLDLQQSGYRKFQNENYECVVDVGHIGADYIPGHAHADTFNFVLQLKDKPFIVDTGLSTYETNDRRTLERSTSSHNTVELNGMNQSEVWGGFRVADRAYVTILEESKSSVKAVHDGYKKRFNALHVRAFYFEEDRIMITDNIDSVNEQESVARLHFHPTVTEEMIIRHVQFDIQQTTFKTYDYASEFNLHVKAIVLEISFADNLEIKINL